MVAVMVVGGKESDASSGRARSGYGTAKSFCLTAVTTIPPRYDATKQMTRKYQDLNGTSSEKRLSLREIV